MKKFLLITILSIATMSVNAQILGGVLDKATDKLEDKLADRLADALYEAMIDDLDSAYYEAYKRDSINGETDASYGEYLARMAEGVELPPSYSFDYRMKMRTQQGDEEADEIDYLFAKNAPYFGVITENKNEETLIVYDADEELLAMYNLDEKEAYGLPTIYSMSSSVTDEYVIHTFEKTGKSKNILGYNCDQYRYESDRLKGTTYIAQEFPISWSENFKEILKQYSPNSPINYTEIQGMMLESMSIDKESEKETTSTAIDFKKEDYTIKTADFETGDK